MIGALGGPLPIPGSLGAVGGIAGMLIAYGVRPRDAAVGAILLHQAIGQLVPLVGGAIAYTIIRWHLGPLHCLRTTYLASEEDRSPPPATERHVPWPCNGRSCNVRLGLRSKRGWR